MFRPWIAFSILFLAVAPYSRVHAQDAARRERARELTVQADHAVSETSQPPIAFTARPHVHSSPADPGAKPGPKSASLRNALAILRHGSVDWTTIAPPNQNAIRCSREIEETERLLIRIRKAAHADELPAGPAEAEFDIASAKIEDAHRRIEHLRVAAENLRAAGIPRLADELIQKAEAWDRQLEESRRRVEAERAARHGDPRDTEIHELQEQNERLRDEVRALREELERR